MLIRMFVNIAEVMAEDGVLHLVLDGGNRDSPWLSDMLNRAPAETGFLLETNEDLITRGSGAGDVDEAEVIEALDGFRNGKIFVFVRRSVQRAREEALMQRLDRVRRIRDEDERERQREERQRRELRWERETRMERESRGGWLTSRGSSESSRQTEFQGQYPFHVPSRQGGAPPSRHDLNRSGLPQRGAREAAVGFRRHWDDQDRNVRGECRG